MTPSADTYGRLRLAFMFHDTDPETFDKVMAAWAATSRDASVRFADLPSDIQQAVEEVEASPSDVSPQGQLHSRLGDTTSRDLDPDDRDKITDAYLAAGGDGATWDDLPADIRTLIEHIEATVPRTSWDDPADAPDDTSHMDD